MCSSCPWNSYLSLPHHPLGKVISDLYVTKSNGNSDCLLGPSLHPPGNHFFPSFHDSLGTEAPFGQGKFPERDSAMSHYQPAPKPARGTRASFLTERPGQCPPQASNSAGPNPNLLVLTILLPKYFLIVTSLVEVHLLTIFKASAHVISANLPLGKASHMMNVPASFLVCLAYSSSSFTLSPVSLLFKNRLDYVIS